MRVYRPSLLLVLTLAAARGEAPKDYTPVGKHAGGVASAHFTPDGKRLASAGGDKTVRVWDLAAKKELYAFKGPADFGLAVRVSPDGKTLAAAGREPTPTDNPIYRWDLTTGKELPKLAGHPDGVRRLVYTPDGKYLISGGFDGTVRVWELATGKEARKITAHVGAVMGLALSADGKLLATAGASGVHLWDPATGKEVRKKFTAADTTAVAFSPDGRLLAAGERDGMRHPVRLYEAATGRVVSTLLGHKGEVPLLVFSADGRTLFTGSYDRGVRLWEVHTGLPVRELAGHSNWVWGVALSADDRRLASAGADGSLLLWEGAGRPVVKPVKLTAKELEGYWADLSGADAGRAYKAVAALASDPAQGVSLLAKQLPALRKPGALTPAKAAKLTADLDAEEFADREKAMAELGKGGWHAEAALHKVLAGKPSAEAKRRAEKLLAKLTPVPMPPEERGALRGVYALELAGGAEARKALAEFAKGEAGLTLTEESAAALRRLAKPAGARP